MKKLYVNAKQQVTITCVHCGGSYTTTVPLHIRGNTPATAKCPCGEAMQVVFEFRQAYRKRTFLQGLLQRHVTDVVGQAAQIRNLSQSGLQLTTRWWRNLHTNDVLSITFILDNPQRSKIDKRIIVKYIDQKVIGATFCPEDQLSYQKEIGFYLMGQQVPRETVAHQTHSAEPVVYGYV
ncbi:hypothetical protein [Candidatus Entotheonella palauensis]|uniref:PilZ domain-containing protein n=1 Tax=Candidatus Entotheonella gemina TaxID=1429439 RepID=W4MDC1_9BACT|nr:hypothetical protein [Candidatus Entotheonella palauensis]ETX08314.1 MAG: hypothetical protein ETSY2_06060 [Candidatus Entotheonella gemina]